MARVVVAVSHSILGECIRLLLQREKEIQVISRVRDGAGAIQAVKQFQPDLLIMNVHMVGQDGFETTRQIRRFNPALPILLICPGDDEHAAAAAASGATAFLNVGRDLDQLGSAALAAIASQTPASVADPLVPNLLTLDPANS